MLNLWISPNLSTIFPKIFDDLLLFYYLQTEFQEKIIGQVVLTKYNNKTYRITDVDFSQTPESTFPKRTKEGNVQVSYLDYYQQVSPWFAFFPFTFSLFNHTSWFSCSFIIMLILVALFCITIYFGQLNIAFVLLVQAYGVRIQDRGQPLLISKSSARQMRSGQPEFINLIPELCVMTGLTDEMR